MSSDVLARAEALLDAGRAYQAVEILSRGLATDPGDVAMLRVLARAQLEVDPEQALRTAQALVARDPHSSDGHYFAALAHDLLGNRKQAVASARAAMAIEPDDPHVLMVFAVARSRRPRGRRECMSAAKRAIELAPDDSAGYFAAGAVELHKGHWRRSAKWFKRALEKDPHDQSSRLNLAIAQEGAGDLAAALGGVDALLRFDPTDRDARETLDEVVYTTLVHLLWIMIVVLYLTAALRGIGDDPSPAEQWEQRIEQVGTR